MTSGLSMPQTPMHATAKRGSLPTTWDDVFTCSRRSCAVIVNTFVHSVSTKTQTHLNDDKNDMWDALRTLMTVTFI